MIQIFTGAKGEGKTKKILEMANDIVKSTNGHIVFIDDDKRSIYNLPYEIRFVDTSDFMINDLNILFGFICGILSQDNDIEKIFIDGVDNIVKEFDNNSLNFFINFIEKISNKTNVDFIMSLNKTKEEFSENLKEYLV